MEGLDEFGCHGTSVVSASERRWANEAAGGVDGAPPRHMGAVGEGEGDFEDSNGALPSRCCLAQPARHPETADFERSLHAVRASSRARARAWARVRARARVRAKVRVRVRVSANPNPKHGAVLRAGEPLATVEHGDAVDEGLRRLEHLVRARVRVRVRVRARVRARARVRVRVRVRIRVRVRVS